MLEIDAYVVNKIRTDSTMITLLGITSSDYRIYMQFPSENISYVTSEAAIIYRNSMGSRDRKWSYPSQISNIMYFFRVLSVSQVKVRQIIERLLNLFDKSSIETASWLVKWVELMGITDGPIEGTPTNLVYSCNITFAFNVVVTKEV